MQTEELLLQIGKFHLTLVQTYDETSHLLAEKLMEIESDDPFVNYGISKALKTFIVNCKEKTDFTTFILLLMKKLQTKEKQKMKLRILACLNCVLTSKVMKKLDHKDVLIHIITQEWNNVSENMLNTDLQWEKKEELNQNEICLFEFIKLWKKTIKQIFESQKSAIYEVLQEMNKNTSVLWNVMLKLNNPMFSKAILKLFSSMLPYGELLSQSKPKVHAVVEQIAVDLFDFFQNGGLSRILIGQDCGFTGATLATIPAVDKLQLQLLTILMLKTTAIIATGEKTIDDCIRCVGDLDVFVKPHFKYSDQHVSSWIFEMFAEQDDMWIETLLILIDTYNLITQSRDFYSLTPAIQLVMNPHQQFIRFLTATNFDDSVLVDWLTSPETCFLLYFMRYLKLLRKEWNIFLTATKELSNGKEDKISSDSPPQVYLPVAHNDKELGIGGPVDNKGFESSSGLTLLGLYESDSSDISSVQNSDDDNDNTDKSSEDKVEKGYDCNATEDFNTNQLIDGTKHKDAINIEKTVTYSQDMSISKTNSYRVISPSGNDIEKTSALSDKKSTLNTIENSFRPKSEPVSISENNKNSILISNNKGKDDSRTIKVQNGPDCDESHYNLCSINQTTSMSNKNTPRKTKYELCKVEKLVDSIISCIIRVRLKVTKLWMCDLFPYNPDPLILNISKVEELYESADL